MFLNDAFNLINESNETKVKVIIKNFTSSANRCLPLVSESLRFLDFNEVVELRTSVGMLLDEDFDLFTVACIDDPLD